MKLISKILDKILIEWSYRVDDGMPNPKNSLHLVELRKVLNELQFSPDLASGLIQNLTEKEDSGGVVVGDTVAKARKKAGKGQKYKSKRGKKVYVKGNEPSGKKPTKKTTDKKQDKPVKKKETEPKKPIKKTAQQKKNEGIDHKKVDDALNMNESEAKKIEKLVAVTKSRISKLSKDMKKVKRGSPQYLKLKKQKDKLQLMLKKKGIGLGTPMSRAGEGVTHKALTLLQEGKTFPEIEQHFEEMVNQPGISPHILSSTTGQKWLKAGISAARMIANDVGVDNINTISWDTPEGRNAIGVDENFDTASDMFVQTKDGKKIGISLKQDGKVFLNSGGWDKQIGVISKKLKENGLSDQEIEEFNKVAGKPSYDKGLSDAMSNAVSVLESHGDELQQDVDRFFADDADGIEYAKGVFGPKYETYRARLKPLNDFYKRIKNGPKSKNNPGGYMADDIKALARLCSDSEFVQSRNPELYQDMRQQDVKLTKRTMEHMKNNPSVATAFKKNILKGIHVENILGLSDRQDGDVDEFKTVYGIPPDGAQLTEDNLINMFGEESGKILKENLSEVRDGKKDKKELLSHMADQMDIDYRTGEILFKHKSGGAHGLFLLKARSRGVGSAPTMELSQTPFMAYSLKEGGELDYKKWQPETRMNFLRGQSTSTKNEIKNVKDALGGDPETTEDNEMKDWYVSLLERLDQTLKEYQEAKDEWKSVTDKVSSYLRSTY